MRVYLTVELDVVEGEDFEHIEWVVEDVIDNNTDYVVMKVEVESTP